MECINVHESVRYWNSFVAQFFIFFYSGARDSAPRRTSVGLGQVRHWHFASTALLFFIMCFQHQIIQVRIPNQRQHKKLHCKRLSAFENESFVLDYSLSIWETNSVNRSRRYVYLNKPNSMLPVFIYFLGHILQASNPFYDHPPKVSGNCTSNYLTRYAPPSRHLAKHHGIWSWGPSVANFAPGMHKAPINTKTKEREREREQINVY